MLERYRLKAATRKEDRLEDVFPIEKIQEFVSKFKPNVIYLIYDRRRKRRDHVLNYTSGIKDVLFGYFNVMLEESYLIPKTTGVVGIRIEYKNLEEILPVLIENQREFNFADQLCILKVVNGKTESGLIVSSKMYYKWIKENFPSNQLTQIDKIPYKGRTTIENEVEKKLVKKALYNYFSSKAADCLFKDAKGKVGFEKLVLPGKEDHIHWRRKLDEELFEEVNLTSKEDFKKLVEEEDAICFYPSLTKDIVFDGKIVKVKHKFVSEYDAPEILRKDEKGMELVEKISNTANSLARELGIPSIYLFSGSKSARNQCSIDYTDILKNIGKINKDFPFLGYALDKKPNRIDEIYRNVVSKCLNSVFYLELLKKLSKEKLLYRYLKGKVVPNVTFDPGSTFRTVSILVDFPRAVSIGVGSPKTISRNKDTGEIVIFGCAPIQKYPVLEKDKLWFDIQNLSGYFERNYQIILARMEKKINTETLEKIFEKFIGREREFFDFQVLKEEEFLRKHYGASI